jgi:hypothetical protein
MPRRLHPRGIVRLRDALPRILRFRRGGYFTGHRLELAGKGQRLRDLHHLDRLGRVGFQHGGLELVVADLRRLPRVGGTAGEGEATENNVW